MTQKIRIKLKGGKAVKTNEKIAEGIVQTTLGDSEHMPAREVLKILIESVADGDIPSTTFADTILHMIEMGAMEARLSDAGLTIEDTREFVNDSASTILGLALFGDLMEAIQNRGAKVQVWTEHDIAEAVLRASNGGAVTRRQLRHAIELVKASDEWLLLGRQSADQMSRLQSRALVALAEVTAGESR